MALDSTAPCLHFKITSVNMAYAGAIYVLVYSKPHEHIIKIGNYKQTIDDNSFKNETCVRKSELF